MPSSNKYEKTEQQGNDDDEEDLLINSIELTREEKLACVCARFKVNDPTLKQVDLADFDIFCTNQQQHQEEEQQQDPTSDHAMMSIVSLLQEGARSNTLVNSICLSNSNLNDEFVIQFMDSLQDLAKSSRRRQFLQKLDLRNNQKLTDAIVFPILECLLHHSNLSQVLLEGTQVSQQNQDLVRKFSSLQKFPAAVKKLAWEVWTSPSYISQEGRTTFSSSSSSSQNHHAIIAPPHKQDQIPNIQFAVLFRDDNDPRAYTSDAVDAIVGLLEEAPDTLRTLRFDTDCIRGDASAERLARYFRDCPSSLRLRELNVRNNFWTSRGLKSVLIAIEEQILKQRKTVVGNENNNTISSSISSNLTVLDIGNNDIDDSAITQLTTLTDNLLHNLTRVAIDGNRKISPAAAQDLFRACSINVEGATLRPALDKIDAEYETLQQFVLDGRVTAPMSNVGMRAIFTKMLVIRTTTNGLSNQNRETTPTPTTTNHTSSSTSSSSSLSKMMPNLEEIIIPNHNFGVDAVKLLARLINTHEKLTIIDISRNAAIDDECVHHLVRALYVNNSVIDVDVSGCSVSPRLAHQLSEACALNREPSPMKYYVQLRAADPSVTKLSLRKKNFGATTTPSNYTFARVTKKLQLDAESFRWIRDILDRQPQIVEVDLSGNENIGNDVKTFDELVELVRMGLRFSKLNISFTHLSNEQAQRISSALYLNHHLSHIISTGNAQLDGDGSSLLQTATTMNQLPSQFKVLYRYLNNGVQGITKICFDNKNNSTEPIGNEGAKILLSSLNRAPHVRHLILNFQQLTDSLAPELERFLAYQSCLVEISLAHNSLGDACAVALAEVIGTHRETTCTSHLYSAINNNNNNNNNNKNNTSSTKSSSTDRHSSTSSSVDRHPSSALLTSADNKRFRLPEEGGGLVSLDLSYNLISDHGVQEIIRGVQHHLFAALPYTLRSIDLSNNNTVTDLPTAIAAINLRLEWCLQPMEFQAVFARTLPLLLRNVLNQKKDFDKEEARRIKIAQKERRKRERREVKAAARARRVLEAKLNRIFEGKTGRRHPHDTAPMELPDDDLDDEGHDLLVHSDSSSSSSSSDADEDNKNNNEDIITATSITSSSNLHLTEVNEFESTENVFNQSHNNNHHHHHVTDTPQTLSLQSGGAGGGFSKPKDNNNNKSGKNNAYSSCSFYAAADENISLQSSSKDPSHHHQHQNSTKQGKKKDASSQQVVKKYSGYIWNEQEMTFVGNDAVHLNDESFKVLHGLMLEQQVHFKFQPSKIQTVRFPRHRFNLTQLDGIGKLLELFSSCSVLDLSECNFLDRSTEEAMIEREKRVIMTKLLQQNPRHQLNTSFLFAIGGGGHDSSNEMHEDEYTLGKYNHHLQYHGDDADDEHASSSSSLSFRTAEDEQKFLLAEQMLKRKRLLLMNEIVAQTANVFSQHQQLSISQDQARKEKLKLEEETMKKLASRRREVVTKEAISMLIEICIKCPHIHRIYLTTTQYAVKLSPVDNEKLQRRRKRQEKEEEEVAQFYQNEFSSKFASSSPSASISSSFGNKKVIIKNGTRQQQAQNNKMWQNKLMTTINNKTEDECHKDFMHAFDYFYDVLIDEDFWRRHEIMIRSAKKKRLFKYEKEMLQLLRNNNNSNNAIVDDAELMLSDDDDEDGKDRLDDENRNIYENFDEDDDDDEEEEDDDDEYDEEEEEEDEFDEAGNGDDDGASSQRSSNDSGDEFGNDSSKNKIKNPRKNNKGQNNNNNSGGLDLLTQFLNNNTPNTNTGSLSAGGGNNRKKKTKHQSKDKNSLTSPGTESLPTTHTSSKLTSPTANSLGSTTQRLQHLQEKQKNDKKKKEQLKKEEEKERIRRRKRRQRKLQRQRKAAESDFLRVPATEDPQLHNLEVRLQAVLRANAILPPSARQVWVRAALAHWAKEDKVFAAIVAEEEEERLRSKKEHERVLNLMKTPVAMVNKNNNNAKNEQQSRKNSPPALHDHHHQVLPTRRNILSSPALRRSPEQQQQENNTQNSIMIIKKDAPAFWRNLTIGYTEEFARRDSKARSFQQALYNVKEQIARQLTSPGSTTASLSGGISLHNPTKQHASLFAIVQTTTTDTPGKENHQASLSGAYFARQMMNLTSGELSLNNNNNNPSFLEDSVVFSLQQSEELTCAALSFLLNSICPVPFLHAEVENFVELKKQNDERLRIEKEEREKEEAAERQREKSRQEAKLNKRRQRELLGIDPNLLGDDDEAHHQDEKAGEGRNLKNNYSVRFSAAATTTTAAETSKFPLHHQNNETSSMIKYFSDKLLDRYHVFRENIKLQQEKFQSYVENEIERTKQQIDGLFQQEQRNLDQRNNNNNHNNTNNNKLSNNNTTVDSSSSSSPSPSSAPSAPTVAAVSVATAAAAAVDPAHAALALLLEEIYEQKNLQDQRDQLRDRLRQLRIQLTTCKISRTSVATRATPMGRLHVVDLSKLKPLADSCVLLLTCWLRCVAPQAVHVLSLPFLQSATSRESVAVLLESEEGRTIRRFTMGQDPDILLRGSGDNNNDPSTPKKSNEKVETLEEFALMKKINQLCERNRKGLFFPTNNDNDNAVTTMNSPSMFANRFKSVRNYVLMTKNDQEISQKDSSSSSATGIITFSDYIHSPSRNNNNNEDRITLTPRSKLELKRKQQQEAEQELQRKKIIDEKLKLYQERRKRQIALLRTEIGNIDHDADREQGDWTAASKLGGAFGVIGGGENENNNKMHHHHKNANDSSSPNNNKRGRLTFSGSTRHHHQLQNDSSEHESGSEILDANTTNDDDDDENSFVTDDDPKNSLKYVTRGRRFVANDENLHRSMLEQYQVSDVRMLALLTKMEKTQKVKSTSGGLGVPSSSSKLTNQKMSENVTTSDSDDEL